MTHGDSFVVQGLTLPSRDELISMIDYMLENGVLLSVVQDTSGPSNCDLSLTVVSRHHSQQHGPADQQGAAEVHQHP